MVIAPKVRSVLARAYMVLTARRAAVGEATRNAVGGCDDDEFIVSDACGQRIDAEDGTNGREMRLSMQPRLFTA